MTTTITIDVPRDWWLSSNARLHRMDAARRTRWLRALACTAATGVTLTGQRYRAVAYIAYPKGATSRVDPNNGHPTTKALIDGCVDAGLLVDDDARHLLGPDHRRDVNTTSSDYRVRICFEEVAP